MARKARPIRDGGVALLLAMTLGLGLGAGALRAQQGAKTPQPPPLVPGLPDLPALPDLPLLPPAQPEKAPAKVPEKTPPAPQPIRGTVEFDPQPPPSLPEPTQTPALPPATTPLGEWTAPGLFQTPVDPPLGYTGRTGVQPRDTQSSDHFVPFEDRWRLGFPAWDRYGKGHPRTDDYPYVEGSKWDPFNQNVLKGDFPIIGQNVFLMVTATSNTLLEYHEVPIPTTPFESTENPRSYPFFGRKNQFIYNQNFILSLDLFHGDAGFRQADWKVVLTPIFNINYLAGEELGVVNPDVRRGVDRGRTFLSLNEWFVETKLADVGPNFDFISMRIGSQPFVSDFRGFIFADINRGARLFGNLDSNRGQWNLAFFAQQEKDTNTNLNTFTDRHQRIVIGNVYYQDFIFPGYTAQANVAYNHDDPTFKFDKNDFLVRPDPVGTFNRHGLDVVYLGWTGDGHINRFNIDHAFYLALGRDSLNPLANRPQDITGEMGAIELSYDRDWARFRTSLFWSSGDRNPRNSRATGFDSIFDNPNFAGGEFSYWQRQSIRILGVNLVQRESLIPDLRSSKIQGQSNFVNPGLVLLNFGADYDVTPKFRVITNANFLWFDTTESLKLLTFQENIHRKIGTDLSMGFEYRPLLSNNIIMKGGISTLLPGQGFRDIYNGIRVDINPLMAVFLDVTLTY